MNGNVRSLSNQCCLAASQLASNILSSCTLEAKKYPHKGGTESCDAACSTSSFLINSLPSYELMFFQKKMLGYIVKTAIAFSSGEDRGEGGGGE